MNIEAMKQEINNIDAALWRSRTEAVRTSASHIQIGHAIDALGRLKVIVAKAEEQLRKEKQAPEKQEPVSWRKFNEWMVVNLPGGTIIGDPSWWAHHIYTRFIRDIAKPDYEKAYLVWQDKTEWVQETVKPHELGMHRADVLKQRIEELKAQPKEPEQEPVGEIVAWPNDVDRIGIEWMNKCPPAGTKIYTTPPQMDELLRLLKEARTTLEMWKDVAPAVSLCADIDSAIAKASGGAA